MNKLCCLIGVFFFCGVCKAQNLVPNGDFEQYSNCPTTISQLDSALFWFNPSINIAPGGTPDYFNGCAGLYDTVGVPYNFAGYQQAHSGIGYSGIYLYYVNNYREYVEGTIVQPLIANACYHLEVQVALAEFSRYSTSSIGIYFSDTMISNVNNFLPLPFTPQIANVIGNLPDTLNWKTISGNFTASGGENYFVIGNFNDNLNTDTIPIDTLVSLPISYLYIDDVCLSPCLNPCTTSIAEQSENVVSRIYPNPFENKLHCTINNGAITEITLFDFTSRKLLQQIFSSSISLNTEQLAKGIYLYEVRNKNGVIKKGKVVKD